MADILIIGSSHVKRFQQFVRYNNIENLELAQFNVAYHGISGGKVTNDAHICELEDAIIREQPHYMVAQFGSNDLDCDDLSINDIEVIILRWINLLFLYSDRYSLKIAVCQLLFRRNTRYTTPEKYNSSVIYANTFLKNQLQLSLNKHVIYWKFRGLKCCENDVYESDGVHLNWAIGYPKFYMNIRGAVLQITKHR